MVGSLIVKSDRKSTVSCKSCSVLTRIAFGQGVLHVKFQGGERVLKFRAKVCLVFQHKLHSWLILFTSVKMSSEHSGKYSKHRNAHI